jgi:hypothetical protein
LTHFIIFGVAQKLRMSPEHQTVWNTIAEHEHLLHEPIEGIDIDLASKPDNYTGIQTMFGRMH